MVASVLPGGGGRAAPKRNRGHGGNAAQAVNLDTGHHVDAHGHAHKTASGQKAMIGPDTLILAAKMGHPPMTYAQHALRKTNVHKHLNAKAKHPHPNAVMQKNLPQLRAEAARPAPQQTQAAPPPMLGGAPPPTMTPPIAAMLPGRAA